VLQKETAIFINTVLQTISALKNIVRDIMCFIIIARQKFSAHPIFYP